MMTAMADARRLSTPATPATGHVGPAGLGLGRAALAVFVKDLRIELATREIVTTAAFFAALVAILASVSFATGPQTTTRVAPGALWLAVMFSSVLALGRTWQRERDDSALMGLLVSPIPRAAIWCGKAAGVLAFGSLLVGLFYLICWVDIRNSKKRYAARQGR